MEGHGLAGSEGNALERLLGEFGFGRCAGCGRLGSLSQNSARACSPPRPEQARSRFSAVEPSPLLRSLTLPLLLLLSPSSSSPPPPPLLLLSPPSPQRPPAATDPAPVPPGLCLSVVPPALRLTIAPPVLPSVWLLCPPSRPSAASSHAALHVCFELKRGLHPPRGCPLSVALSR